MLVTSVHVGVIHKWNVIKFKWYVSLTRAIGFKFIDNGFLDVSSSREDGQTMDTFPYNGSMA